MWCVRVITPLSRPIPQYFNTEQEAWDAIVNRPAYTTYTIEEPKIETKGKKNGNKDLPSSKPT